MSAVTSSVEFRRLRGQCAREREGRLRAEAQLAAMRGRQQALFTDSIAEQTRREVKELLKLISLPKSESSRNRAILEAALKEWGA